MVHWLLTDDPDQQIKWNYNWNNWHEPAHFPWGSYKVSLKNECLVKYGA